MGDDLGAASASDVRCTRSASRRNRLGSFALGCAAVAPGRAVDRLAVVLAGVPAQPVLALRDAVGRRVLALPGAHARGWLALGCAAVAPGRAVRRLAVVLAGVPAQPVLALQDADGRRVLPLPGAHARGARTSPILSPRLAPVFRIPRVATPQASEPGEPLTGRGGNHGRFLGCCFARRTSRGPIP